MSSLEVAIETIMLDLIINQLDHDEWVSDWLSRDSAMDDQTIRSFNIQQVALQAICFRAPEIDEGLKEE